MPRLLPFKALRSKLSLSSAATAQHILAAFTKNTAGDEGPDTKGMLEKLLSDGGFFREENEAFWIYEYGGPEHYQTALLALTSVEDLQRGDLMPAISSGRRGVAENEVRDGLSAALCAYYPSAEILIHLNQAKKEDPAFAIQEGFFRHRFWRIEDAGKITVLQEAFAKMQNSYLLSALCPGDKDSDLFSAYIPYYDIKVNSFYLRMACVGKNRRDQLMRLVKAYYAITEQRTGGVFQPKQSRRVGIYLNDTWYELRLLSAAAQGFQQADQEFLLKQVLNGFFREIDIHRYACQDWKGLIRDLDPGDVVFSFYQTDKDQVISLAAAGRPLPNSWMDFGPCFPKGLLMHASFLKKGMQE